MTEIRGIVKRKNKWISQISFQNKKIYLGTFIKIEDAVKARKDAELKYYDEIENLKGEIWKDIEGYVGIYKISNKGRVKSLERIIINSLGRKYIIKEVIRKEHLVKGYLRICLRNNKIRKFFSIHRLVAQAFIPNPENKPQINHKDGNKTNNYVENLEWNTSKENNDHAIKIGLKNLTGSNNPNSKLSEENVIKIINDFNNGIKRKYLINKYNMSLSSINRIVNGDGWKNLKIKVNKRKDSCFGSNKPSSKLNDEDVKFIFNSKKNNIKRKFLSDKYNVSLTTINDIINQKKWKHITSNLLVGETI